LDGLLLKEEACYNKKGIFKLKEGMISNRIPLLMSNQSLTQIGNEWMKKSSKGLATRYYAKVGRVVTWTMCLARVKWL
jgi:hypothetical protein